MTRAPDPLAVELAALLGPRGVEYLMARCRATVRRARDDGVVIRSSLVAAVAFVEHVRAATPGADSGADSMAGSSCWLSTTEAAALAGVDTRRVRSAIAQRAVRHRRRARGKGWEVEERSLRAWIESRRTPPYGQPAA
jgi:hypothetical protein